MEVDQGYRSARPWSSASERLVDDSLRAQMMPDEEIRARRPPSAPQQPLPPRDGYQREDWTVGEVLNIDRRTPTYRSWTSGYVTERQLPQEASGQASTRFTMGSTTS